MSIIYTYKNGLADTGMKDEELKENGYIFSPDFGVWFLEDECRDFTYFPDNGTYKTVVHATEKFMEDHCYRCYECGAYSNYRNQTVDGDIYCLDCLKELGYTRCWNCGEWSDDVQDTQDGPVCQGCLESYYSYCDDCEEWFNSDEGHITANGDIICDSCYEDNYFTCWDCDGIFPNEDAVTGRDGHLYCDSCYDNDCEYISDYHSYFRSFMFYSLASTSSRPKSGNKYIGVETELHGVGNYNDTLAREICENYPFICASDSSVRDGFEAISDACTYAYWKEKIDVESFLKLCKAHGYHTDSSVGMHVHVSRNKVDEIAVGRIVKFCYDNYDNLVFRFGRRESTGYCKKPESGGYDWQDWARNGNFHCCCINTSHCSTIEFRFPQSTGDYEHFMAIIEFADAITEVSGNGKNCNITWNAIYNYSTQKESHDYLCEELRELGIVTLKEGEIIDEETGEITVIS